MNRSNNNPSHQTVIACLLMFALFVQVLFPIQVHMHHETDMGSHHHGEQHFIDYHNKVIGDIDHSLEEHIHTIETTSDFIAKKNLDNKSKFALIFTLVLLALATGTAYYQRRYKFIPVTFQKYFQLSPPLRAPPL